MRLTFRQQRFVAEYLIDLDPRYAAIRAGYRSTDAGSYGDRLLRQPHVAAAVARSMSERARRTGITRERVLAEYAKLGCIDLRALACGWRQDLEMPDAALPDAALLADEIADAIAMIAEAIDDASNDNRPITLLDKMQALDALAALLDLRHPPGGLCAATPQGNA
jgi:phage terminase small subunit